MRKTLNSEGEAQIREGPLLSALLFVEDMATMPLITKHKMGKFDLLHRSVGFKFPFTGVLILEQSWLALDQYN